VDEALRGYMTKYDCSSADINPIGGICKMDLKRMMIWAAESYNLPVLEEIAEAPPTVNMLKAFIKQSTHAPSAAMYHKTVACNFVIRTCLLHFIDFI
jgi:NH3-dependent NAD+ synthetase